LLTTIQQTAISEIAQTLLLTNHTNYTNHSWQLFKGEMSVKRTPFIYPDRKPLGAVGKQFPSPLARKPLSLEFNGGCTVLSIKASNSILSEKALQAFKYAFLRNQKIGIGSLPSNESPTQTELDKATAAYEIARNLVGWFDEFCVEEEDSHDLESNTEEEHRSCDLKKDELFSRSGIDAKKDSGISNTELKVFNFNTEIKDLDLDFTNDLFPLEPDLKGAPLLGSVVKESATCEAMDFFESPFDGVCEMRWNPTLDGLACDGFDVDISLGALGSAVPLLNDSENFHDNLTSPISSPSSPVSPYSPSNVFL